MRIVRAGGDEATVRGDHAGGRDDSCRNNGHMLAVTVSLLAALVYGAADFTGGLASSRRPPILVTAIASIAGLAFTLPVAMVFSFFEHESFVAAWSTEALVTGALGGLAAAVGIVLLYAALAIGPMSVLSPVTALVSALVPFTFGVASGSVLSALGWLGIGIAGAAIVLVATSGERAQRPSLRALLLALGAGVGIGLTVVSLDAAPDGSGLVPLIANRAAMALLLWGVVLVTAVRAASARRSNALANGASPRAKARSSVPFEASSLGLIALCGVLDACANALIIVALRLGDITVVSVLTSLYPLGTVVLALMVLHERIRPLQLLGIGLALSASVLLAAS